MSEIRNYAPPIPTTGGFIVPLYFENLDDFHEHSQGYDWYQRMVNRGEHTIYHTQWLEALLNIVPAQDICGLLLDCLQNNESVKQAIEEAIKNSAFLEDVIDNIGGGGVGITINETTIVNQLVQQENRNLIDSDNSNNCNPDNIYGAVWALTQWLDGLNRDFLEKISANDNLWRNLANASSSVPLLGALPQDEVLDFIADAIENILANYDASITQSYLRDEISCDLFCMAKANCSLDLSDVMGYFAGKLTAFDSVTATFTDLLAVSAGLGVGSTVWYDYMAYFGLAVLAARTRYLGYNNLDAVVRVVQAGLNDADADHAIFCDECPPEAQPYNVLLEQTGVSPFNLLFGTLHVNNDARGAYDATVGQHLTVTELDLSGVTGLTEIQVSYFWNGSGAPIGSFQASRRLRAFDSNGTQVYDNSQDLISGDSTISYDLSQQNTDNWSYIYIEHRLNNNPNQTGLTTITRARFIGNGVFPISQ